MHVLLVTALVGGGVGHHVTQLAQGLLERGHQVSIACPTEVARRFDLAQTGATVLPVELGHRPRPGADHRARRQLREAMEGVDVVHAHGMRAGAAAALARPRARRRARPGEPSGPRLVVTSHNGPPTGGAGVVYELLERVVCRRADLVLGVSPDLVERARRRGACATGAAVVPSRAAAPMTQVDRASARASLRAELGLPADAEVVLTVGRLAAQKRIEATLAAYHRVVAEQTPPLTVLLIAGDGPQAPVLAELVAQGPGRVLMLGQRDDVPRLLAAADVVVSSSRWEGQPLILQEALAAGAAIVATEVGGTGVLLGDGGMLVPGDAEQVVPALAQAIRTVLTDASIRADLQRRARRRAGELPDAEEAVQAVLASYRGVP